MIGVASLLPMGAQESQDHDFEAGKNLEIFNAIYRNLDMAYVDTLNAGQTIGTGICYARSIPTRCITPPRR